MENNNNNNNTSNNVNNDNNNVDSNNNVDNNNNTSVPIHSSPLRTIPDVSTNSTYPWGSTGNRSSGSDPNLYVRLGGHLGFDMYGSFVSDPYRLNPRPPQNLGSLPYGIPPPSPFAPIHYQHMPMYHNQAPSMAIESPGFDDMDMDWDISPVVDQPTTTTTGGNNTLPSSDQNDQNSTEIYFGGRLIQATPVALVPVMSSTSTSRTQVPVSVPRSVPLPDADNRQEPLSQSGRTEAAQAAEQPDQTAARQREEELETQMYMEMMQRGVRMGLTPIEDNELPSGSGDGDEGDNDEANGVTDLEFHHWSYERLLDLQARLGVVQTGVAEHDIDNMLPRRTFGASTSRASAQDATDPCCCVCREEYTTGEQLGVLDCEHEFHFDCIKQWLMRKNTCPLCRNKGLDI